MKSTAFVATVLALILSACGARPAPTPDPAIVQASAIAAASTMIAMTQAAIPTATETSVPSPTPSPTASLVPTLAIPATATSQPADCYHHPLQMGAAGPKHDHVIRNETDGTVNVSLTLYEANAFGECGVISYSGLGKNGGTVTAGLPSGNWYIYAWGKGKGGNIAVSTSFFVQPAQFLKLEICIRANVIKYSQAC